MMRLRRASVIAPLFLLVWAAPACAERAWVMWAHGTDQSGAEEWQRVEEAPTVAECWAIYSRLKLAGVDDDIVRTVVDGCRTTAYYRDGHQNVVEFTCLHDTADPRGAKAK